MFKKLMDFSYQRNRKEALGFYLSYLLIALIIGGICGVLTPANATTFQEGFAVGMQSKIIPVVVVLYILGVSGIVFIKRKLQFRYLVLLLINTLVSFFGGAILGLLLPAFMTTRNTSKED